MKTTATILAAALALTACAGESVNAEKSDHTRSLSVWTDPETGCKYFLRKRHYMEGGLGGMTPKLRTDGKPDCPGVS